MYRQQPCSSLGWMALELAAIALPTGLAMMLALG